jgi:hypothetical protein
MYPHHLDEFTPYQGVNGFILSDPYLPSQWLLLTDLHLVVHPPYHALHQHRQLLIELITLKLLWLLHVVP